MHSLKVRLKRVQNWKGEKWKHEDVWNKKGI